MHCYGPAVEGRLLRNLRAVLGGAGEGVGGGAGDAGGVLPHARRRRIPDLCAGPFSFSCRERMQQVCLPCLSKVFLSADCQRLRILCSCCANNRRASVTPAFLMRIPPRPATHPPLRSSLPDHTNVLMAVGTGFAVVCLESIPDESERAEVVAALAGKETIAISLAQMGAFCGNVLELRDRRGLPVLAASSQAAAAFTAEQTEALLRHVAEIVHAPVETLERIGGGGVRCTLAEVFVNERRGAAQ